MVLFKKAPDVNRCRAFCVKRFANGENSRASHLAGLDAAADTVGIVKDRCDVKNGGKAPAGKHLFHLQREFDRGESFGVQQAGGEDVHMAVPEAGGDDHAFAIDDGDGARQARGFGGGGGANSSDAAIVNNDGGVFDRGHVGREINLCANEGEV